MGEQERTVEVQTSAEGVRATGTWMGMSELRPYRAEPEEVRPSSENGLCGRKTKPAVIETIDGIPMAGAEMD